MNSQPVQFTKQFLRLLTPDELYTLATMNPAVQSTMTERLFQYKAFMVKGRPSFEQSTLINEVIVEKRFQKASPASGIQEYALASGCETTYSASSMKIEEIAGDQIIPVSRLPIPLHCHATAKKTVREGSDLVACFLAAITKWEGSIVPSTNLNILGRRGYSSMTHYEGMVTLIPLMHDAGIGSDLDARTGKKGREWAFHIMEKLQKAEITPYAMLHTYLTIHVFGIAVRNNQGEIMHSPAYQKSLKITSASTTLGSTSCFWVGDIPKDCRQCFNAVAPTVEETYNAFCEGMTFRGGPGSAIGCLMMSIESWGLPTQTRADLEMELAILHGMKGDITCIGVPEYKKMHYVASFQHYKSQSRLYFIRDKKQ